MPLNKVDVKFIVLDIEGTTTSINFVKDVLFKYARENVDDYLSRSFEETETQDVIDEFRSMANDDNSNRALLIPAKGSTTDEIIASVVQNVVTLMDADAKVKPLKKLQGFIWKEAFESGPIKGHIYDDVLPALKHWQKEGRNVYIYSSGSAQAQKLLFQYSEMGNLLKYFKGHFDTTIGQKKDFESYRNITKALDAAPKQIVFVTDIPGEALAATEAGLTAILSERDGNEALTEEDREKYRVVRSFEELYLEKNN